MSGLEDLGIRMPTREQKIERLERSAATHWERAATLARNLADVQSQPTDAAQRHDREMIALSLQTQLGMALEAEESLRRLDPMPGVE
jgi:hypothetical protein